MSGIAIKWASGVRTGKASYKSVLLALAWFHHEKQGHAQRSVAALVEFTELNRKTVLAAIDWLDQEGLISCEKREGSLTRYVLHLDATSPKNGTASRRDTSTNFGTGPESGPVPKTGPVPNLGPVPKTDKTSTKIGTAPVPNLGHDKEQEKEKNINTSCHDSKNAGYLEAARAMWLKIQPLTAQTKEPNLESWANDIRLIVERDGRTPREVWEVFTWANQDGFWQTNILCPAKLRKQFPALYAKMNQGSQPTRPGLQVVGSTRERTLQDDLNDTSWAT